MIATAPYERHDASSENTNDRNYITLRIASLWAPAAKLCQKVKKTMQ